MVCHYYSKQSSWYYYCPLEGRPGAMMRKKKKKRRRFSGLFIGGCSVLPLSPNVSLIPRHLEESHCPRTAPGSHDLTSIEWTLTARLLRMAAIASRHGQHLQSRSRILGLPRQGGQEPQYPLRTLTPRHRQLHRTSSVPNHPLHEAELMLPWHF